MSRPKWPSARFIAARSCRINSIQPPARLVHWRIQRIEFGEDLTGRRGPGEGLGVLVVLGDIAVDRGLKVDHRVEAPALSRRRASAEKKVSTAFSQEPEVG